MNIPAEYFHGDHVSCFGFWQSYIESHPVVGSQSILLLNHPQHPISHPTEDSLFFSMSLRVLLKHSQTCSHPSTLPKKSKPPSSGTLSWNQNLPKAPPPQRWPSITYRSPGPPFSLIKVLSCIFRYDFHTRVVLETPSGIWNLGFKLQSLIN